ncbi:hypothetical protein E2C01_049100 [Portunus trituberculatus]|uniref:Uncharacterized protein n=1 Tax=Portunus trituberculatus TaxID=210409 RepID=A0A5B7GBZ2_PORTR|nr:hypothetical protein [Portunus trituberculatus]
MVFSVRIESCGLIEERKGFESVHCKISKNKKISDRHPSPPTSPVMPVCCLARKAATYIKGTKF